MGYLNNFPLLNMNKSKETVYFTHKFIPIYLVTEALIRAAFHLLREKTHTIPKLVRYLSLTIKAHDSSYEPDNRSNAYKMLHL
jgi:hypothetical protein